MVGSRRCLPSIVWRGDASLEAGRQGYVRPAAMGDEGRECSSSATWYRMALIQAQASRGRDTLSHVPVEHHNH